MSERKDPDLINLLEDAGYKSIEGYNEVLKALKEQKRWSERKTIEFLEKYGLLDDKT